MALAARAVSGFDVAPAIAHDVARCEIDIPDARGFEQQAGLRLAAGAARGVVVRADADVVQLQIALQARGSFRRPARP